jgi:enoyl-CoA hydratase/carnithine racemase
MEPASSRDPAAASGLRIEPSDDPRVVRLVIDRPARGNALTPDLLLALEAAVLALPARGARAAVLEAAGGRVFSAGYDFAALAAELARASSSPPPSSPPDDHPLERALRAIESSSVPIVAAVAGPAIGAGCELACACDLRVAGPAATFGFPPARLGIVYSHTGIARVLGLVGLAATKEMFMTGAPIDAVRAERIGIANRLAAAGAVEAEGLALAKALAANAPLSLAGTKEILNRFLAPPRLSSGDLREIAAIRERAFRSADLAEGLAAALEKRAPRFEGR